jgi:hypothetical protein
MSAAIISHWIAMPAVLRLLLSCLLAANSAALAIYLCLSLADVNADYLSCLSIFLIAKLFLFSPSRHAPLSVQSGIAIASEITLWGAATTAVIAVIYAVKFVLQL